MRLPRVVKIWLSIDGNKPNEAVELNIEGNTVHLLPLVLVETPASDRTLPILPEI